MPTSLKTSPVRLDRSWAQEYGSQCVTIADQHFEQSACIRLQLAPLPTQALCPRISGEFVPSQAVTSWEATYYRTSVYVICCFRIRNWSIPLDTLWDFTKNSLIRSRKQHIQAWYPKSTGTMNVKLTISVFIEENPIQGSGLVQLKQRWQEI
jgi:hypothetical protein